MRTLSATLPHSAAESYRLFCEVERVPEWLRVVRSAMVRSRDAAGRAREVAFLSRAGRATFGYTCFYRYFAEERGVSWTTAPGASIRVAGLAQFEPLGARACLMSYWLDLSHGSGLADYVARFEPGHAASEVMNDFREFVDRALVRSSA